MLPARCRALARCLALAGGCALLAGCAQPGGDALGYYWQSLRGHLALMHAARPLPEWLAAPDTPEPLRQRLQLAQQARTFASRELALPDNASYRRYARLDRPAAVWNVVAAPPWSLALHTWCFPVTGCIGYRGYFDQEGAQAEGRRLQQQGLEVSVYPVPAYSTLGYSNWLGGDPLLSTFIGWPEGDFVRLLFHELAHQQAYASGDTRFNESYATAVERLGVQQWLHARGDAAVRQQYERSEERRGQWRALTQQTRARLAAIYESKQALAHDWQALAAMKSEAMQEFTGHYAQLRECWLQAGVTAQQLAPLDRWAAGANNASFAAQGAYDDLVPAFMALFEREGRDWPRFHAAVRAMAAAPPGERETKMRELNQP
ncbi:aminopeptidase [Pulveribacter suum]|uniref:Aminopeptidase n=1 Tax=Pulveribacter suum TaxID=2116657 RepID=A0A2P1NGS9_9BURK|nr:aminopeptidase [Pulveribacter suum]AVP56240.1 aminopeptidase [Pulveribacter suum]